MSYQDYANEEEGFFQKYKLAIGIGVVVLILASVTVAAVMMAGKARPPKPPEMIVIHLQPPPPPPPPPPIKPPPPPPEQKMVMQPPVQKNEVKPKEVAKDLPKPPGPPAPAASGPPSDFGLAGAGGSGGSGDGGGGGSRWGWYAGEVQAAIVDALRRNDKTRGAQLLLKVRIWSDTNGLVTRAELIGTSGDSELDRAIRNDVLTGLHLQEPPPQGMPMPIVMLIREQRPS